ncbi:uncharacterized protein [Rutidosis leptorrhynchoides]|uniref:uncharacterized protein isoform X2 n=1 Tax=Rutidosis leptorrhynchoides TaxID=125765 RepID=UPI003A990EE9
MYFAVLLDLTMKKVFLRHGFRSIVLNTMSKDSPLSKVQVEKKVGDMIVDVETRMESLLRKYEESFDKSGQNSGSQEAQTRDSVVNIHVKNSFVSKWRSVEEDTSSFESEMELSRYLSEPKLNWSPSFDLLKWWKQNENRSPIVALMARDILAIQISSVASESVYSTSGRVLDPYRTRLSRQTVEALICTQDWVESIPRFEDEVNDILNDNDITIEMEEAIKKQNRKEKKK